MKIWAESLNEWSYPFVSLHRARCCFVCSLSQHSRIDCYRCTYTKLFSSARSLSQNSQLQVWWIWADTALNDHNWAHIEKLVHASVLCLRFTHFHDVLSKRSQAQQNNWNIEMYLKAIAIIWGLLWALSGVQRKTTPARTKHNDFEEIVFIHFFF